MIDEEQSNPITLPAPSTTYATRKVLLQFIAPASQLRIHPVNTERIAENGYYIAQLTVDRPLPNIKRRIERHLFISPPDRSIVHAEENVATQALEEFCSLGAIPVIDYLYRCSLTTQQSVSDLQQSVHDLQQALSSNICTLNVQRAYTRVEQQRAAAEQERAESFRWELCKVVLDMRSAIHESGNALPLHINKPTTDTPTAQDTLYRGPATPRTKLQILAVRFYHIIANTIRATTNR